MRLSDLRVYLVADPEHCRGDLERTVAAALAGGVTMVQLRAKALSDREQLSLARHLAGHCRNYAAPFIVNDRLDIALAAGADGVHLGIDDLPVLDARRLAGPGFVIGYSPETDPQIASAAANGADYLGVGPVFETRTKADAGGRLGLGELSRRVSLSPVPVVGIGGITRENASAVVRSGTKGVAVVSAILAAVDPALAARELLGAVGPAQSGTGAAR